MLERAKMLRDDFIDAVENGTAEDRAKLVRKIQAWDRTNPAYAVGPDIEGSISRRARQQAIATATRTPIGVKPEDRYARELTRYAGDIEFQAR